ncbi:MAG: DNA-3-methyladenine glycosylase 2 family protein [Dehalococcoidia bacterium]|nr:DNA-3-methyladenine glycosylase 2 family protein [Dehalococcoidia bacterium]
MRRRPFPYDAEAARAHLMQADPVMRGIVKRVGPYTIEARGEPYEALLRSVLYQQLAGAAAAAIERRFLALFGDRIPRPQEMAAAADEDLRAAGLSRQKASYLRSIGEHFVSGEIDNRALRRASDEEVIAEVTRIKGVGRWTADMLLIFCLGRPDVLPVGDLGVRNAMQQAYRLDDPPDAATMERIAECWRPYRSAGTWYLWRRGDVVTL